MRDNYDEATNIIKGLHTNIEIYAIINELLFINCLVNDDYY